MYRQVGHYHVFFLCVEINTFENENYFHSTKQGHMIMRCPMQ